jgi:acyl-CoA synthetase (NDP forming)/RimJ/RimL family protein N-acetyltransferase
VAEDEVDGLPEGYPARWDADVVLSDGGTVHVRPVLPADGRRIQEFHARQSPESIYFRYFTAHPTLSDREVEQLTHVDYEDRMAFVALRDDVMVGVARYDRWPGRSDAEVAFFVDDAYRGRGMATLLLEYLAVAAREVGLTGFTATVLPTNRRMVAVFRQAGFEATSSFEEGVIEVRLDLQPTREAAAAVEARANRAEARSVRLLLEPRSVAVVGASRQRGSVGHDVLRNLLHHELCGPVYPVNRVAGHVAGVRAYPSLGAIGAAVDLAVICVPAAEVPAVVEDCGRHQVPAVVVLSAGFAEAGPAGEALGAATLAAARRFGIRLLGPNCLGVINTDPEIRLHATFATPQPRPGTVALLAESGTIGGVVLDHMASVGLGISSFAAIGNRADVSANDLLQYWAEDPRTEIVLLNLESFGNPRKFSRIARALARTKPVVAVKSGLSARAYPDDTARRGEPDDGPAGGAVGAGGTGGAGGGRRGQEVVTVGALLRQTGVVHVDTLSQLIDAARVLAAVPELPAGPRVAVVGNAGGSLVTAADACVAAGMTLADPDPAVHDDLGVGPTRLRHNPLDLGFQAGVGDLEAALAALVADPGVDSVLVVCTPSPGHRTADLERAIAAARAAAPTKPVVASIFGPHAPVIRAEGVPATPVFDFPDAAAHALGQVSRYAAWRSAPEGETVVPAGAVPADARAAAAAAAEGNGAGWLPPEATAGLLAAVGVTPVPSRHVHDVEEAVAAAGDLGYPVAVKTMLREHHMAKSEAAGLALDIHGDEDLRATCARLTLARGTAAFPAVVQSMVPPGVDVAVSVAEHPVVGPVLRLGPGGVATRVAAVQVQVLPFTDRDAARCVADSAVAPLLDDAGRAALEDLLLRVGTLVEAAPEVEELDLNPVILSGGTAHVTDAQVWVAPLDRERVPPVRRL